jgi:hypothetical protein
MDAPLLHLAPQAFRLDDERFDHSAVLLEKTRVASKMCSCFRRLGVGNLLQRGDLSADSMQCVAVRVDHDKQSRTSNFERVMMVRGMHHSGIGRCTAASHVKVSQSGNAGAR